MDEIADTCMTMRTGNQQVGSGLKNNAGDFGRT